MFDNISGIASQSGTSDIAPLLLERGRQISYGAGARALVHGKIVLVTGAGGSIGSEVVRQVRTLQPAAVYLLDHDEGALHSLQLELHGHGLLTDPFVLLADIRDADTISRLFADIRPDIVFHAAAHKHLPLLERFPAEGVKANIGGTRNVVAAAAATGAELVVNISTDKAAHPTSVLGATKRVAEDIAACYATSRTRVASVRFGNVLGSRGSLLHSLKWQVSNARDITVTDPAATRFFMTIPEAASLVIEAAVLAGGGETYVLDMGRPIRILDLVRRYLDLAEAENRVVFTGLRNGEKLHEQLVDSSQEAVTATTHPRITRIDRRTSDRVTFLDAVDELCKAVSSLSSAELRGMLWMLADPQPVSTDTQPGPLLESVA
ncbi:polysaccharide biosynthesis protein [Actinoplanes sp. NPDC048791]|uniref:polysaccharide biosynthesis protein n=1 Tax=Actinoplanes sp. NPDC048791 TaxID=3154623 RepID=UPI0033ECF1E9